MRILITNDDGIHAPGLVSLARVAREFGEVKIVAPDRERSACGHSMTMRDPLRVVPVDWDGLEAYHVNGVPVDCVNVGLTVAWPDGRTARLSQAKSAAEGEPQVYSDRDVRIERAADGLHLRDGGKAETLCEETEASA